MKRYKIYYDGFDKPFCQIDSVSGKIVDAEGKPLPPFPDYVFSQWERGGGRIEERDYLLGQEPPVKKEKSDDSPPPGLDEFEYIDWCIAHDR